MSEFEKQLKSQSFREIPEQWREEILRAAKAEVQANAGVVRSWWRDLLWPCPQAWAALAGVWAVVLILNFSSGEAPTIAKAKPVSISPEMYMALQEQRRFYIELIGEPPAKVAEPPHRPRAEMKIETFVV
jgi:hypothetical protein